MADDTIRQIVGSGASSAVNPHPSLIQQRAGKRRRDKDQKKKKETGDALKNKKGKDTDSDTVTFTARQQDREQGADTLKPISSSEKPVIKTIDIRI